MKMRPQRRRAIMILLLAMQAAWAVPLGAQAQGYPDHPIKMVVPLAVGGPNDTAARIFAKMLGDSLGQNVFIDNRSGASGVVGTEAVLKSPADGYTLLFGSSSVFAVNPAVMPDLRFDVRKDLKLVGLLMQTDLVFASRQGIGIRKFTDLVAASKVGSNKFNFANSGAGGITHLMAELIALETGVKIVQIPFRGAGPAILGLLSGDADLTAAGIIGLEQHMKEGSAIGLAIASPTRSPLLPDVPTFAELGYPGIEAQNWYGIAVSAKTPAEIVEKLDTATARVATSREFQDSLLKIGMQPMVMNSADAAPFIARELDKWSKVAAAANIKLDK